MDVSETINSVIKDFIFTQTKTIIMVLGKIIQRMVMGSSDIFKECCMLANGLMTNNMDMDSSIGLTELYLKAILKEVIRRKVDFLGLIKVIMKENS